MYSSMAKGTSRAEVTSNSKKLKPVVLLKINLIAKKLSCTQRNMNAVPSGYTLMQQYTQVFTDLK